jgi:hypothetical protein
LVLHPEETILVELTITQDFRPLYELYSSGVLRKGARGVGLDVPAREEALFQVLEKILRFTARMKFTSVRTRAEVHKVVQLFKYFFSLVDHLLEAGEEFPAWFNLFVVYPMSGPYYLRLGGHLVRRFAESRRDELKEAVGLLRRELRVIRGREDFLFFDPPPAEEEGSTFRVLKVGEEVYESPLPLDGLRRVVREKVLNAPAGVLNFLGYSIGAGKTTSIAERVVSSVRRGERILLFYFSPLKFLNEKVRERFEEVDGAFVVNESELDLMRRKGVPGRVYAAADFREILREGKLKLLKQILVEAFRKKPPLVVSALTTHSIIPAKGNFNTAKHLRVIISEFFRGGGSEVYFVFDEISGSSNFLGALNAVLSLPEVYENKDKIRFFLLDANLPVNGFKEWFEKGLRGNFNLEGYLALKSHDGGALTEESFALTTADGKEYAGVFYGGSSFPAKAVRVAKKILEVKTERRDREKRIEALLEYLLRVFRREGSLAIYLQDKSLILPLADALSESGYSVSVITRELRRFNADSDFVFFTSAGARGIDIPKRTILVFLSTLNPSVELLNVVQAVGRIRGLKEGERNVDSEVEKRVELVYLFVPPEEVEEVNAELGLATNLLNLAERLVSYQITLEGRREVYLLFPPQRWERYEGFTLFELVSRLRSLVGTPLPTLAEFKEVAAQLLNSLSPVVESITPKDEERLYFPYSVWRASVTLKLRINRGLVKRLEKAAERLMEEAEFSDSFKGELREMVYYLKQLRSVNQFKGFVALWLPETDPALLTDGASSLEPLLRGVEVVVERFVEERFGFKGLPSVFRVENAFVIPLESLSLASKTIFPKVPVYLLS